MPAPRPLRLVQALANTYDALTDREILRSPSDLSAWVRRNRLLLDVEPRFGRPELDLVLLLRESLRSVLASNNGAPIDDAAVAALDRLCRISGVRVSFSPTGAPGTSSARTGVEGVVGAVLVAALAGAAEGRWGRLKACPACGWVFYDHSRNRAGTWCTMAICGSRAKMRSYRRRTRLARRNPTPS